MRRAAFAWALFGLLLPASPVRAQDEEPPVEAEPDDAGGGGEQTPVDMWTLLASQGVKSREGPCEAALGDIAKISVPEGYRFLGRAETTKYLTLSENPTSGRELGAVAPDSLEWFCFFSFDEVGYVNDDEKDDLDAAAILAAIREGTRQANVIRKARGWTELQILGWETPPRYNAATNNLEWAVRGRTTEGIVLNHNTRLLGRSGVMEASLVSSPDQYASSLGSFRKLLGGFAYEQGSRYSEYRTGDKLAEYGLSALVAGGALAVAAKSGLLAKLWKFLVAGAIAVAAFFKKLFGGAKAAVRPRKARRIPPAPG